MELCNNLVLPEVKARAFFSGGYIGLLRLILTYLLAVILKSTVNHVLYDNTQTQPFWVQVVLALIPGSGSAAADPFFIVLQLGNC